MAEFKIIHDSIYGTMKVEKLELDLMETLEMQRLNGIKQLGLSYLVFPGANHTRIEHSLGASHLAKQISDVLSLGRSEKDLLVCAGLLHDVGHGPFSHTLETTLEIAIGMNHVDLTKKMITGEEDIISKDERKAFASVPKVNEVLEKNGVDPKEVADLISTPQPSRSTTLHMDKGQEFYNEKGYLTQIINSPIDVDQIDYLLRDAYYTGVAHGIIDADRLVQTFALHHNDLVVDRKGLSALEGMFVARALMFSSIYFHKTVRIAELMLARAVEHWKDLDPSSIQRMVDSELMSSLIEHGGLQRDVALKIKYRKLYKKALVGSKRDLSEDQRESLKRYEDPRERRKVEKELCERAGAPEGSIIVDYPPAEIKKTEPRISKTDIRVLDNGRVRFFKYASDMGRAIEGRDPADWLIMIAADRPYLEKVSKIGKNLLF
jgi:HD superfamily phosphohydrolase